MIAGKCQQNTNRKPWSLYRQVTGDVTSGIKRPLAVGNRYSAIIDIQKNGCNFQTMHARQVVLY
jgi:hypothetical protein